MDLGTILASGWTSGLSLYATAFLLGVAGRIGWVDTPALLTDPWTLAVTAVLAVIEFVVDKIPWLDSIWDTVHLFIRPLGGAVLGGILASETDSPEVLVALVAGTFALSAHGAKSSTRALANTSPEPVSNVALSFLEDGIVAGMIAIAVAYPLVAGVLAVIATLVCTVVILVTIRALRRIRARLRSRNAPRPV